MPTRDGLRRQRKGNLPRAAPAASQLRDSLELLKMPADLQDKLEQQAARDAAEAPIPVTVVLLGREHEQFERAMAAAKEELGMNARRGQCLERVCLVFLDSRGEDQSAAGNNSEARPSAHAGLPALHERRDVIG